MATRGIILVSLLTISLLSEAALSPNIIFGGRPYIERWSDDHQQEYTPSDQPNLDQSPEMLKIHRYPSIQNAHQLTTLAQTLARHYQQAGDVILQTRSISNVGQRVAEQLVVVVSGDASLIQTRFIRFTLIDNEAMVIVFSKRFVDAQDYDVVRVWVEKYGREAEQMLLSWEEPFN